MIRRRTITSYVWNSVSGNKMVILSNCIRNFFRKFELIGNSVQGENPAPDNPQEIKSAGRKSKNLFNIADLRVGQVQKDGTINEKQIYYRTVILDVPQDGKYRITFNSNDDYTMLYFTEAYANGAYSQPYLRVHAGSPNYYITLAKGKNILSFSTHTASGNIVFTTDHNIMIAAESETLDYEPYGYFLEMKITGKNLFDEEKAKDANNWTNSTILPSYKEISIYVGKGNSVNISYLENLETGLGFYANIAHSENDYTMYWLYHSDSAINITKNKNFISRNDYIVLRVDGGSVLKFFEYIKTLQIEIGSRQTPYEPYTEQTMQIALDDPLRGIGEYKDMLTKDGVVRRIKEVVITEDTPITCMLGQYGAPETNTVLCRYHDTSLKKTGAIICGELKKIDNWAKDEESVAMTEQGIDFRLSRERLGIGSNTTPEENKVAVIKYLTDHPLHCVAELNVPTTEPLPESVQQQLQALHSENGTTHVFVDSGEVEAGINIEYKYKS